jgi:primosomal protein N' (replication factor Y)
MPRCLQVLLPLPLPAFDFLPPFSAATDVSDDAIGKRVVVPWQQGVRVGIVMAVAEVRATEALSLREAVAFLDDVPFVTATGIALISQLAEHTLLPAGIILRDLLPYGLSVPLNHDVRLVAGADVTGLALPEALSDWHSAEGVAANELDFLRRQGLLEERASVQPAMTTRLLFVADADGELDTLTVKQKRALEHLQDVGSVASAAALARAVNVSAGVVRGLINKGLARYQEVLAPPEPLPDYPPEPLTVSVSAKNMPANIVGIAGGVRRQRLAALLPVLEHLIEQAQQALVLAPEHTFIQETVRALGAHLPVLTLSGDLSERQRQQVWQQVQQGTPCVLVGSHLALLAPFASLAGVVVLEEGSSSYKLLAGSRLFVPRAAYRLAQLADCPLWLADVVPSARTAWLLRQAGQPSFASSQQDTPQQDTSQQDTPQPDNRTAQALYLSRITPRAHVVDLNQTHNYPLSADLIRVLKQVAERKRQAILLAPRRGFSAALRCQQCGYIVTASHCDCALPLRYHQRGRLLRCHQCQYEQPAPGLCPNCHSDALLPARAAGTEWVAEQVKRFVAEIDTYVLERGQTDDLSALYAGSPGVLISTTAIFRHAPLPNVSLIGLTLLDTLFSTADFRSDEVAYRSLCNLTELAPQRRPLILVQTFQPEHPVMHAWLNADNANASNADTANASNADTSKADPLVADAANVSEQDSFMDAILARRERYHYPPYAVLGKVQVSDRSADRAARAVTFLADAVRTLGASDSELIGPMPAPVAHARGYYHHHLIIHTDTMSRLHDLLQPVRDYRGSAKVRWDVDPDDIGSLLG